VCETCEERREKKGGEEEVVEEEGEGESERKVRVWKNGYLLLL
jgi:hypothetical protein